MPRRIRISPRARLDLDEIWEFIASDSVAAADRVKEELQQSIRNLGLFPGKGHVRSDVRDQTLRFWSVYSYMIAYCYDDEFITVVRIVHGQRNMGPLLEMP